MKALARPLLVLLAMAAGCVRYTGPSRPVDPAELSQQDGWMRVPNMTLVEQEEANDCGAAAAAMVLTRWTRFTSLAEMHALAPSKSSQGLRAREVRDVLRAGGLRAFVIEGKVTDLEHEVHSGRPVVVGTVKRLSDKKGRAHFEVVVAVNPTKKLIVTLDPSLGWRQSTYAGFEQEWKLSGHTAIVALPTEAPVATNEDATDHD